MGIAGEIAAERAAGPGTFQAQLLDALANVGSDELRRRARVEGM
jgi:hydroxyethylthiazole kinase